MRIQANITFEPANDFRVVCNTFRRNHMHFKFRNEMCVYLILLCVLPFVFCLSVHVSFLDLLYFQCNVSNVSIYVKQCVSTAHLQVHSFIRSFSFSLFFMVSVHCIRTHHGKCHAVLWFPLASCALENWNGTWCENMQRQYEKSVEIFSITT